MARTYYIPIERHTLAATHPQRWMILPVDADDASTACDQAHRTAASILPGAFTAWAAVLDCPSFDHMQELRESFEASRRRVKPGMRVAGYA